MIYFSSVMSVSAITNEYPGLVPDRFPLTPRKLPKHKEDKKTDMYRSGAFGPSCEYFIEGLLFASRFTRPPTEHEQWQYVQGDHRPTAYLIGISAIKRILVSTGQNIKQKDYQTELIQISMDWYVCIEYISNSESKAPSILILSLYNITKPYESAVCCVVLSDIMQRDLAQSKTQIGKYIAKLTPHRSEGSFGETAKQTFDTLMKQLPTGQNPFNNTAAISKALKELPIITFQNCHLDDQILLNALSLHQKNELIHFIFSQQEALASLITTQGLTKEQRCTLLIFMFANMDTLTKDDVQQGTTTPKPNQDKRKPKSQDNKDEEDIRSKHQACSSSLNYSGKKRSSQIRRPLGDASNIVDTIKTTEPKPSKSPDRLPQDRELPPPSIKEQCQDLATQLLDGFSNKEYVTVLRLYNKLKGHHHAKPKYLSRLLDAKDPDNALSILIKLKEHNLQPKYLLWLLDAKDPDNALSILIKLKEHNLQPKYLSRLLDAKDPDKALSILIELKKHHLQPKYLSRLLDTKDPDKALSILTKMKNVYDHITPKLSVTDNGYQVHGLLWAGKQIKYNGITHQVPTGIYKIWTQLTDQAGNFSPRFSEENDMSALIKNLQRPEPPLWTWYIKRRDTVTTESYKTINRLFV